MLFCTSTFYQSADVVDTWGSRDLCYRWEMLRVIVNDQTEMRRGARDLVFSILLYATHGGESGYQVHLGEDTTNRLMRRDLKNNTNYRPRGLREGWTGNIVRNEGYTTART